MTVVAERTFGRNCEGRKRFQMLDDLVGGGTKEKVKRLADNRLGWRGTIRRAELH